MTGGLGTENQVSLYNEAGFLNPLPSMNEGRYDHGCGHYINNELELVDKIKNLDVMFKSCIPFISLQVFLVAGGFLISSTEILIEGRDRWSCTESLPTTIEYLRGVSLNNDVIMTGLKKCRRNETKYCSETDERLMRD